MTIKPPFEDLASAYQLHYYICMRTKFNKPLFEPSLLAAFKPHVDSICQQYGYHLLRWKAYDNQLRVLLSLKPSHWVADVTGRIKGNLARLLRKDFPKLVPGQIWARGYFAKSVGTVDRETVTRYISSQAEHHGYRRGSASLICAYDAMDKLPDLWRHNHATFNLSHHLVLETQHHKEVFDDVTGKALIEYWLRVARKKRFEIGQLQVLPNHAHLFVCLYPTMSVLDCVRALLNNSWALMNQRFCGVIKQTEAWNLWEPSFYAGGTGSVTTAEVKSFLASDDG